MRRDIVGAPFKDTPSVALNRIIRFTALFGLLAVPLAIPLVVTLSNRDGQHLTLGLSLALLVGSTYFVYRSFYGKRIQDNPTGARSYAPDAAGGFA